VSRIPTAFRRLRKANEVALIPYLQAGYPSLEATRVLLPVIGRQGADLIALGTLPGGYTQQDTTSRPDVTLADCLRIAAEARRTNEVPLLLAARYTQLSDCDPSASSRQALASFTSDCAASGIDGLFISDLMPQGAEPLKSACDEAALDLVLSVSLFSTEMEIEQVARLSTGFIHCVPVPGAKSDDPIWMFALSDLVRRHTDLPLVVGPDVSTPEQVAQLAAVADGVLVGSALASLLASHPGEEAMLEVSEYIRAIKAAALRPDG
jgi:tryptophan synthase alpha chain